MWRKFVNFCRTPRRHAARRRDECSRPVPLNALPPVQVLFSSQSPLTTLTILKKLCDHALLFHKGEEFFDHFEEYLRSVLSSVTSIFFVSLVLLFFLFLSLPLKLNVSTFRGQQPVERLFSLSGKLQVLAKLLVDLKEHGHRPLIFSQSTRMLDIIQLVIQKVKSTP